jgi:hypothetical protein
MDTPTPTFQAAFDRHAPVRAWAVEHQIAEPPAAPVAAVAEPVKLAEPRVSKQRFADQVGMSVRWVEQKIAAGMPCEYVDGRPRLRVSEGEDWLRSNGHLSATASAGPRRG